MASTRLYITFNDNNEKDNVIQKYLNSTCYDAKAEIKSLLYKVAMGINIYNNAPIEDIKLIVATTENEEDAPIEEQIQKPKLEEDLMKFFN